MRASSWWCARSHYFFNYLCVFVCVWLVCWTASGGRNPLVCIPDLLNCLWFHGFLKFAGLLRLAKDWWERKKENDANEISIFFYLLCFIIPFSSPLFPYFVFNIWMILLSVCFYFGRSLLVSSVFFQFIKFCSLLCPLGSWAVFIRKNFNVDTLTKNYAYWWFFLLSLSSLLFLFY